MFRLRISKSYGGETPMCLITQHVFTDKVRALAAAIQVVPQDIELNWTKGETDDIKFDFCIGALRYQVWIDDLPTDPILLNIGEDHSITEYPRWSQIKGYNFD